jgi:Membrane proteins related to metalloendopeptidases
MRNIFYKYNPQSLNYERVYPTRKKKIVAIFRHLLFGVLIGGALFAVVYYVLDSPYERQLKKENQLLETQYQILSKRLSESLLVLEDLQRRDDDLYRVLFNAEPIPLSIRKPGVGGSYRYEALLNMPYADLVIETTRKLDMLNRELYVQSNSYDELTEMVKNKEERIKCIPAIKPIAPENLRNISSGFGWRIHPIYGSQRFHSGMDLNASIGTPIIATGNGVVETVKFGSGYGYYVVIDHGFGYKSLYAHNRENLVVPGQKVVRGQQIATIGMTGDTTGPHVHYEVIVRGENDNPAKYFFLDQTPEEFDATYSLSKRQ